MSEERVFTQEEVQRLLDEELAKVSTSNEPKMISVIIQAVFDNGKTETASAYHPSGLHITILSGDEKAKLDQEAGEVKTSD